MKPPNWKPFAAFGAFALMIMVAFCLPAMAAETDGIVLTPLAMGVSGDKPAAEPEAPQVAEPTVMIRLGTAHFDPLYKQPRPASGLPVIQAFAEGATGYYVVQFDGPVQEQWKAALQQAGAEIFDYVPDFAFTVRMASSAVATVRGLAHVRWVGLYQPSYRISQKAMSLMYTRAGEETSPPVALRVNIFPGVDLAEVQARIEALGGSIEESTSTRLKTTLKVEIPAKNISPLTGIDGVKWIEPLPQWKLFNNISTDVMNARDARDTHGLYGSGQTVGIADTGLDQGSTSPASLHNDFEDGAGTSRVAAILDTAGDGNRSDTHGHGTHVAGSVLGNGARSGSNPAADSFPADCFAGLAPKAGLVFQAVMQNTTGYLILPTDLNVLFSAADSAGADLHTNSWGSNTASDYSASSQDVDEYMWNHKDFLIHFSAGNAGVDMDADGVIDLYSLGAPATAKNCLTVGASENDRPSGAGYDIPWGTGSWADKYPAAPIATDHVSNNDRGMAAFSSRGPCLDGRYKPDIVAPGTNILSTRSSVASGSGWGVYDSFYLYMGGTSMSTPLTAGASALMREYLINQQGFSPPSAALIKAALLNSAEDIEPGQYGTGADQEIPDAPAPNNVEGWGRLNLGDGIFPTAPADIIYYDETAGLGTGNSNEYSVTVTDAGAPLKVNLVWTDYPSLPGAQGGLVNDLDLSVTDPGASVHYADHASQKSTVTTLTYDEGFPVTAEIGPTRYATRFTPSSYPAYVDSVTVALQNGVPGTNINIVVYANVGGVPGAALYTKSVPYAPSFLPHYDYVTIPVTGVQIASGDFFVGIEVDNAALQGIFRDAVDSGGRAFLDFGSGWAATTGVTWYIRAHVRSADLSGSYDRVNNTLGVTLPTPAVGTYTIRVNGYNVPQGPQPYALVASGNIQDTSAGVLQFNAATYSVSEGVGTATITVTRTGGSTGSVGVDYATSDGTATAGSDYTAASGTLSLADGVTSDTFSITIADDATIEPDETVNLTLSNPIGGAVLGANATAVLNIQDDDAPGTLQFSAASYSISESGGSATITVTRTGGSAGSVSVDYATSDGTATAGSDYTAAGGTLSLADGVTSDTFSVTIADDGTDEPDETVNLTLSNPTGGAVLGANTTAVLTIQDDDGPGTLQFSAAGYSIGEGGGSATITVTRTGGSDGSVSVDYATSDGTATAGSDYTAAGGTLSLADGVTSDTFSVAITDDGDDESNETVTLTLSNAGGGATLGTPFTATLTITDDDGGGSGGGGGGGGSGGGGACFIDTALSAR